MSQGGDRGMWRRWWREGMKDNVEGRREEGVRGRFVWVRGTKGWVESADMVE